MSAETHIEELLGEGATVRATAANPAAVSEDGTDAWDGQFEAILRAHLPALSLAQPLDPDDPLRDLGLDSVGTLEILLALEDLYGVEIREESIGHDSFASAGHLWSAVRDWRARQR
jgi:acyl carrier protein